MSVRDQGAGLPPGFEMTKAKGLGMRIISAFVQQLKATMTVNPLSRGTEFVVSVPIHDRS